MTIDNGLELTLEDVQAITETQPEVVEEKKEEQSSVEKQAHYYARHPEKLEEFVNKLSEIQGKGKIKETKKEEGSLSSPGELALQEINKLKIDNAKKDAVLEFGLTKEDLKFIAGNTPEEILENAKDFAIYKNSLKPVDTATATVQDIPKFNRPAKSKFEEAQEWLDKNKGTKVL